MRIRATALAGLVVAFVPALALAHVEVASGPGFASTSQEITFSIAHGCTGVDTSSLRIEIPAAVTSVRAENSNLGKAAVEKDASGAVTAVTWSKPDAELLATDDDFYKVTLRIKVPNAPFTTLYFPAHQTCKAQDGTTTTVDWVSTDPTNTAAEPAPALKIVPARVPGWNKFTVPAALADLSVYFGDAVIVWKDSAAYSANPNTAAQIAATSGVTALGALVANDEVWVKY
jgi:uncharacterized protein YcnI